MPERLEPPGELAGAVGGPGDDDFHRGGRASSAASAAGRSGAPLDHDPSSAAMSAVSVAAVVVCCDRSEAAAADRHAAPLGLDPPARSGIVGRLHQMLLARANLQGERALARLRKHLVRLQAPPDLGAQAEPVESARGEHDRVEPALAALAQPRVDVPAQRLDGEPRLQRESCARRRTDAVPIRSPAAARRRRRARPADPPAGGTHRR